MLRELEWVRVTSDVGVANVRVGDVGTIVHVYPESAGVGAAYEVEFADSDGQTIALLTLQPAQVEAVAVVGA